MGQRLELPKTTPNIAATVFEETGKPLTFAEFLATRDHSIQAAVPKTFELLKSQPGLHIVVGATGSVGKEVTGHLLKEGKSVIGISLSTHPDSVRKLYKLASEANVPFGYFPIDLKHPKDIHRWLNQKEVPILPENVDSIICVAGDNYSGDPDNFLPGQFYEAFNVHAIAPLQLIRHLMIGWKQRKIDPSNPWVGYKSIITSSSVAVSSGSPSEAPYLAGKGAAEKLTLALAREGQAFGISAIVIQPGLIVDSTMGVQTLRERPDIIGRIPGKKTTSIDVADSIMFALKHPTYSGQMFRPNAGRYPGI